mgnify:CR=1 FL=1
MKKVLFVQHFGGVFEHSLWVAEQASRARPFKSVQSLYNKMTALVQEAAVSDQLALLRNHPNLGANIKMTDASVKEQTGAGLTSLSEGEFNQFSTLNDAYTEKFSFPFIMAVRGKTKQEIYDQMRVRLGNDEKKEFNTALAEVFRIAGFRICDIVSEEKPSICQP